MVGDGEKPLKQRYVFSFRKIQTKICFEKKIFFEVF